MGTTTELDLPYPEQDDPNDPPADLQALADQVEAILLQRFTQETDARLSNARPPNGAAGGALDGSYPNPGLADGAIDSSSQFVAAFRDGSPAAATLRSLGAGATQAAPGNDGRLSNSRSPNGGAGGVLNGDYPSPGLADGAIASTSKFTAGLRDGPPGTTSLRSLGTGAQQAASGNHLHYLPDTGTLGLQILIGADGGDITYRRKSGWIALYVNLFTPSASPVEGTGLAQLPPGFRPAQTAFGAGRGFDQNAGNIRSLLVDLDGFVRVDGGALGNGFRGQINFPHA